MGPIALPVLPMLIGLLGDDSPHVAVANHSRSVASHVEAALPQLGPLVVEPLIAALKDPRPRVRSGAATVLGTIHDQRAMRPLIDALADAQTSNSARTALEKFGLETAAPLVTLLDSPNPLLRSNAAYVLGRVKPPQAIQPLAKLLDDDDPSARQCAVDALRQFGPAAIDQLLAVWKSASGRVRTDPELRSRIVVTLGIIRDRRAADQLLAIASDEQEPDAVRAAAIGVLPVHLSDLASDSRLEKVLSLAMRASSPEVRASAANVLGILAHYKPDISKARVVDLLVAALDDPDDKVKRAAMPGLGNWRDPRPVERLLTLLEVDEFRLLAANALGQIGDRRAIEPLRRHLGEKNLGVIMALGKLGDGDSLETIVALLADKNEGVRGAAIDALGHMKDRRATEPLLAVLAQSELVSKGNDLPLRRLAQALGEIKDPRAAEPLIAAARRASGAATTLRPTNTRRDPSQNPVAWPLMFIGVPCVRTAGPSAGRSVRRNSGAGGLGALQPGRPATPGCPGHAARGRGSRRGIGRFVRTGSPSRRADLGPA